MGFNEGIYIWVTCSYHKIQVGRKEVYEKNPFVIQKFLIENVKSVTDFLKE